MTPWFLHRARAGVALATLASLMLLTACSSGDESKATSTTTTPKARVRATLGLVTMVTAGPPAQLADADRQAIVTAVGSYVQDATVAPLEGKPVPDLASHFTAAAAPALQGAERDALLDADVPRATGRISPALQPIGLHALADATGAIDLVGTTLDLTVQTATKAGPITIHRSGELMFTRDGGTWKILSFKLAVTREGAGLGAAAGTSSTTKASA
jgi:hypothetical protein